ncbi:MAG: sugar-transfer associated ATP-grasp domain-containing protein [Candidatus Cloacimonadaceae bacterium]|jgi:hypothetical protein
MIKTHFQKGLKYLFFVITKGRVLNAFEYANFYSLLPKIMGFKQKVSPNYYLRLLYEYAKYNYYSNNKSHLYIMKCVPRTLFTYYLGHITRHFLEGGYVINKLEFYKLCNRYNISVPYTYCYRNSNGFNNISDKPIIIENLEDKNYFVKPYNSSGGKDAKIVNKNQLNNIKEGMIVQELLSNGGSIKDIAGSSSSFNTIRIHTYKSYKTGEVFILAAHLKIGLSDKITDNIGGGAIGVPVDIKTGKLFKYGFSEKPEHTIEGINNERKFEGKIISEWDEIIHIIKQAANIIGSRFIGWDVGISEKGVVIVEANSGSDYFIPQAFYKPFLDTELIRENIINANDHLWAKKYEKKIKKKYYKYYSLIS